MPTPTDDFHTRLTAAAVSTPLTIPTGSVLVAASDLNALLTSEKSALAALNVFTSRVTLTTPASGNPSPTGPLDVTLLPAQSILVRAK